MFAALAMAVPAVNAQTVGTTPKVTDENVAIRVRVYAGPRYGGRFYYGPGRGYYRAYPHYYYSPRYYRGYYYQPYRHHWRGGRW